MYISVMNGDFGVPPPVRAARRPAAARGRAA